MQLRYVIEDALRAVAEFCEDQWFDRTRRIRTSGNVTLARAGISRDRVADSELYQPARPRHIRHALRHLPVSNLDGFSYVDLGSGKGRSLFVAAEFPFRRIIGVEFSRSLHEQALANIRRFRLRARRSGAIDAIHADAREFVLPAGHLVLYLFNPFGAETMQTVLDHLEASLRNDPRHIFIVLLWPRCQDQVARVPGMRLVRTQPEYQIFEWQSER